jgi:hypothetical protein
MGNTVYTAIQIAFPKGIEQVRMLPLLMPPNGSCLLVTMMQTFHLLSCSKENDGAMPNTNHTS